MEKQEKPKRRVLSRAVREARKTQLAVLKQMIKLATSGFGLVAALAWNNVIKEFVEVYIKRYLPEGSGFLSLFIYALIVTFLAVVVTLQLSSIVERLEEKKGKKDFR